MKFKTDRAALSSAAIRGQIGMQGCRASNFSPASAKAIFERYGARKVYDFAAGWGDRLLAALATSSVNMYIGTDPNLDNQSIYNQILAEIVPLCGRSFDAKVHDQPAESFEPDKLYGNDFDLVFTSCPYFNREQYAANTKHQHLQSWYRYPTRELWLEHFLFPALTRAVKCLRKGGILAVNLHDLHDAHGSGRQELCDPMNQFLERGGSLRYLHNVGLLMPGRHGTARGSKKAKRPGKYGEPIWVWQKL